MSYIANFVLFLTVKEFWRWLHFGHVTAS